MQKPNSKLFDFQRLVSENNLCQSWKAVNLETREDCLVKTPTATSDVGHNTGKAILGESFRCQKSIRSALIARATGKHLAYGSLFVEYPYLDPSEWTALTPELFLQHFQSAAPQIGLSVDYLHMLGLVHCDLKLDNFLIRTNGRSARVVMMDLDFLCKENSEPEAKVLGTPEHIAPEIIANDRIVTQSDMYSLGISLGNCLKAAGSGLAKGASRSTLADERLADLVEDMTQPDHLHRPRFLLESLHLYHLIDRSTFESTHKTLLAMLLVSRFRTVGSGGLDTPKGMEKFLRRDNKIPGLSEELLASLAAAYAVDRRQTLTVFKRLMADATVERHADYWHLGLDDARMLSLYGSLIETIEPEIKTAEQEAVGQGETAGVLATAQRLADKGYPEYAYLNLKEFQQGRLGGADLSDSEEEDLLTELVSLARSLNRMGEADRHLEVLIALKMRLGKDTAESLYERVKGNVLLGRLDTADKLINDWLSKTTPSKDKRLEVSFQRMRAWVHQNRGEYDQASEILEKILSEAKLHNLMDLVVLILYNIGILYWRRGDFKRSDELLLKSYELAEREDLLTHAIPVISTISTLAFEQADYARSIKYGKLASKIGTAPQHLPWLPSICTSIANAQIRLADLPKAEYWLQRYLSLAPPQDSKAYLLTYYLLDGFLNLNRSDLASAKDSWHKARMLLGQDNTSRNAGKVYHNLAEAALHQGDFSNCTEYAATARAIFRENDDEASLTELEFISILGEYYSGDRTDIGRLIKHATLLIEKNCRYYAVLCLFHTMLHSQSVAYDQILKSAEPLRDVIRQSRPPLFRAVSCLLNAYAEHEGESELTVTPWKEAFAILLGGRQDFLAMLVGVKIAGQYSDSSNSKHAKKFLLQAQRLAKALGNDHMGQLIHRQLDQVSQSADNSARLIDSFLGISEILTDLGDYRQSLQRLIKFAVDQTGAERGVIFLKSREGADLSVAASLNCDDQSLSDIKDFSMNVPYATMKNLSPLIIENALADQRTNQYESIVCHNILSVICVPLSSGAESIGALYLDHHTIPALFDKEDLAFISSVANFISVTLATARDIRSQVLTNIEMRRDLSRLGEKQSFVTRDPKLLNLFKKLPQVAATRAPVLVLGESGTGKEILGQMIHEYSPRSDKPLVKLNCAAIADSLIESELFGVAKATATDVGEREGRFSAADGGTLYLDEIGDMPLAVQSKVLRVLEYQEFEKVGSSHSVHTDIRFVYATNKNLPQLVASGRFREDLFYRINTITIEISPLRERADDIPILIDHFVLIFSEGKPPPRFSSSAVEALTAHDWPGNVRELKNIVERYCILHPGAVISKEMLPPELRGSATTNPSRKRALESLETERILKSLRGANWNQSKAAEKLGMPITTLRRKIKKYGIRRPD